MKDIKALIIGLDGATWDLIKPLVDEGKLPTFKKLMENSVYGKLESTIPPWTIPAWNSMATGLTPKKLGFSSFMVKKGYEFHPYFLFNKNRRNIWDLLSSENKEVCIANIPSVISSYPLKGSIVPGWLYTGRFSTYPSNLINKLNDVCDGYLIDIMVANVLTGEVKSPDTDKEYIQKSDEVLRTHYLAFKYLMNNKNWEFAFLVFGEPDRIQHRFWHKKEVVLNTYKKLDEYLAGLLNSINKNTNVFLVSDHGFGPVEYQFNMNEWLIKEGYLKLIKQKDKNRTIWLSIANYTKKMGLSSLARRILKILPLKLSGSIKDSLANGKFENLDIDWKNTKAFAYSVCGTIWLNFRGREPEGLLNPSEYDKVRDEIIRKLKNLKIKGQKGSIQVFKKEEIYPKAKLGDSLPDLVFLPTDDGIHTSSSDIGFGEIFTKSNGGGNHRLEGIFLSHGPDIKKGYKIEGAKIYDIAPTILHLFGLPIPDDMDGRVLTEIFEPDSELKKEKPVYVDPSYYNKKKSEGNILKAKIKQLKTKGKI